MASSFERESWRRFYERVVTDPRLFDSLTDAPTPEAFAARVAATAAAHGETFPPELVIEALQATRRAWIERTLA